jgi:hypothetical protein
MQARINDQFNQIAADQQELAADQRQIVALQGLALGAKLAVSSLEQASSTLSDLRTSWGVFTGEIQGVITKVEAGEAGLGTLVQEVFAQSALTEWNLALQYAQQLAEVADQPMAVQTKILPMSTAA